MGILNGPVGKAEPCKKMPRTPSHTLTRTDEALTVKVELPDVKKASEVDLNISSTRLHLLVADTCVPRFKHPLLPFRSPPLPNLPCRPTAKK